MGEDFSTPKRPLLNRVNQKKNFPVKIIIKQYLEVTKYEMENVVKLWEYPLLTLCYKKGLKCDKYET